MKTADFAYDLPEELIAQDPLSDRAASKLLVIDKVTEKRTHTDFHHIGDYLNPGDCLVINNTKVIPARLIGERENTGALTYTFYSTVGDKSFSSKSSSSSFFNTFPRADL